MTTFTCDNVPEQVTFLSCTITQASSGMPMELLSGVIGFAGVLVGTVATIVLQRAQAKDQEGKERRKRLSTALSTAFKVRNLMKHVWMIRDLPEEQKPDWEVTQGQLNQLNSDFVAFEEVMHDIQLLDDDETVYKAEDLFDTCVIARNYFLEAHKNNVKDPERQIEWERRLAAIEPQRISLREHARIKPNQKLTSKIGAALAPESEAKR